MYIIREDNLILHDYSIAASNSVHKQELPTSLHHRAQVCKLYCNNILQHFNSGVHHLLMRHLVVKQMLTMNDHC